MDIELAKVKLELEKTRMQMFGEQQRLLMYLIRDCQTFIAQFETEIKSMEDALEADKEASK